MPVTKIYPKKKKKTNTHVAIGNDGVTKIYGTAALLKNHSDYGGTDKFETAAHMKSFAAGAKSVRDEIINESKATGTNGRAKVIQLRK